MSMRTTKRHFSAYSQLWTWLKTNGQVDENIFSGWWFPGVDSEENKRDPWNGPELSTLFRSDWWRSFDDYSAEHWLPLIALFSGLRLDEIANLRVDLDLIEVEGVKIFDISKHPDWQPKSKAGIRRVPVHNWLLQHGIMTLTAKRKAEGSMWLFPHLIPGGPDSTRSHGFSREFSRILRAMPVRETVTFHSLRHSFRSKLSEKMWPDRLIDTITGHEGEARSAGRKYEHRETYAITTLQEVVEAFVPPLDIGFIPRIGKR